ncbi:MAG TPA: hypothetical protein VFQ22_08670, partial [Longimicrobiales bacterium]|nr:hypothetical protein [Longimicrobiales bacterium]
MRIAVVSPHFPTRALPFRGATHDEQMRRFARAGHDVRAVVPLPWGRRRADGARVPAEERDGDLVIAHPRHPAVPRLPRGLRWALERRLFARAAAEGLRAWGADPDVVLAHSATLPGGLLGRVGGAAFVVSLYDHELFQTAPRSRRIHAGIADTLRRADCAVYLSEALRREGLEIAGP